MNVLNHRVPLWIKMYNIRLYNIERSYKKHWKESEFKLASRVPLDDHKTTNYHRVCWWEYKTAPTTRGQRDSSIQSLPFSTLVLGWGPQNARYLFGTIQLKSPFSTFCKWKHGAHRWHDMWPYDIMRLRNDIIWQHLSWHCHIMKWCDDIAIFTRGQVSQGTGTLNLSFIINVHIKSLSY